MDTLRQAQGNKFRECGVWHRRVASETMGSIYMKIGKANATVDFPEGYWTSELMARQLEQAITVFEASHPGCQGLFQFDNSANHGTFAEDALCATRMQLKPGGKQPLMRATMFKKKDADGAWQDIPQQMVFAVGDTVSHAFTYESSNVKKAYPAQHVVVAGDGIVGIAKGLRQVLSERGLWREKLKLKYAREGRVETLDTFGKWQAWTVPNLQANLDARKLPVSGSKPELVARIRLYLAANGGLDVLDPALRMDEAAIQATDVHAGDACCATYVMGKEADFAGQQGRLEEMLISRGHLCIFVPKFHPELNFIERMWGRSKHCLRVTCDGSLPGLWERFPRTFHTEWQPLSLVRKYSRKSWVWMAAYDSGAHATCDKALNFVKSISKCHRDTAPDGVQASLEAHVQSDPDLSRCAKAWFWLA